jgi:hypothetical protein
MKKLVLTVAAAVLMTAPAHAAWKNYIYKDFSFAVDFPAEPKMTKGTYQAVVAGKVPTTVIGAEEDDTTYRVVISDFRNRLEDTPGILIEAAFIASTEGKVVADTVSRTDNGQKFAKYGRRVAVLTKDGGKKITELYFVGGRMLSFETIISPKGDIGNPEVGRFTDSIRFNLDRDWNVPPPLPANREDGPALLAPVKPGQAVPK